MDVRKGVVAHYQKLHFLSEGEYAPVQMAELAPGVVAVEDRSGECDVMFDVTMWEFYWPDLWRSPESSPDLKDTGLNVLEGIGCFPPVTTIPEMLAMARRQLKPTGNHTWHESPEYFGFEKLPFGL